MQAAYMHLQMIYQIVQKYQFSIKSGSTVGTEITLLVWFAILFKIGITSNKLIYFCITYSVR